MLEISAKPEGAELTSIKKDGIEKLHDGKEFWNRQSPILFPRHSDRHLMLAGKPR